MSLSPSKRLAVACVSAVAVLGVVVAWPDDPRRTTAAAAPREHTASTLQGPPLKAATIFSGTGRQITCPKGAAPTVDIEHATFHPKLLGGTRMGARTYRIALRGSVVNETNSPVRVTGVGIFVNGAPWHPQVARPAQLGAGEEQPLVVNGVYHSPARSRARVAAYLQWDWQEAQLRRCGVKGLIQDD
jgi:hypothetical protein